MRALTTPIIATFALAGATALLAAGCDTSDYGRACGTPPTNTGAEPIGGEQPVVEVVRMQRDGVCETFNCLHHRGLPGYCTGRCDPEDEEACPAGFRCDYVQDAGPLAGQAFCLRADCEKAHECGDTALTCATFGCYNHCTRYPPADNQCDFPVLECALRESFTECHCGDNQSPPERLDCKLLTCVPPPPATTVWGVNDLTDIVSVCVHKEE